MTKSATVETRKDVWTKPELTRLGKIRDVAGPGPNPVQNINNS
jgi:hypothetical protein